MLFKLDLVINCLWITTCVAVFTSTHDGDNPGAIIGDHGWKSFELLTENDSLTELTLGLNYEPGDLTARGTFAWNSGIHNHWDGLGAFRTGTDSLRVFVNHEGTDDATVTAIDINIENMKTWALDYASGAAWPGPGQVVFGVGNAFDTVDVGTGGSGRNIATTPISRLCSGNIWEKDTFGENRGFVDQLFLTGEEDLTTTNAGGSVWILETATGIFFEVPDVWAAGGRWENAIPVDSGNNEQIAILLSSDGGNDQLFLYIGTKNTSPAANILERNGLVGGQVFQFDPDGAVTQLPDSGKLAGTFATETTAPLMESKFEDVHVNPDDPTQAVLAEQNKGVYQIDFDLHYHPDGTLDTSLSSFLFTLLDSATDNDGTTGGNLSAPDNLVWSENGFVYVNEDGSGDDVWQLATSTGDVLRIADGLTTETSGVIDVSCLTGFTPGSVLLTNSYDGTPVNGNNGSLYMLVAPGASLLGDVNLDRAVNLLDIAPFISLLSMSEYLKEADINKDGTVNLLDVDPFIDLLAD